MTLADICALIGLILSFALMFITVYYGMHVVIATFIASVLLILTNWMPLFDSIDLLFQGWGEAIPLFGSIILFGAAFSKVMEHTGAARSFVLTIYGKLLPPKLGAAKRRVWSIIITVLLEVILIYAGMDLFAMVFMMLPILGDICNELNIPRRFIPAFILSAAGIANAIPGAANMCNTIPMMLLGTDPMAGAIPGFVASVVVIVGCCFYLCRATGKAAARGESFDWGPVLKPADPGEKLPPFILSVIPLIVVVIGFNVLKLSSYTLALAAIVGVLVLYRYIPIPEGKGVGLRGKLNGVYDILVKGLGAVAPLILVFLTSGFATLVSASRGYEILVDLVLSIQMNPAVTYGLVAFLLVGIMINPIGALMVAIPFATSALPELNPAAVHRISAFAFIVLDSLPFASGIILAQNLAGLNSRESYKPIFVTTVIWAFVGLAIVVALYAAFPGLT